MESKVHQNSPRRLPNRNTLEYLFSVHSSIVACMSRSFILRKSDVIFASSNAIDPSPYLIRKGKREASPQYPNQHPIIKFNHHPKSNSRANMLSIITFAIGKV